VRERASAECHVPRAAQTARRRACACAAAGVRRGGAPHARLCASGAVRTRAYRACGREEGL
jgi:hypothetical protein